MNRIILESFGRLAWRITWRWIWRTDARGRFAAWCGAQAWMHSERESAPLFWWFHERTLFNAVYSDSPEVRG